VLYIMSALSAQCFQILVFLSAFEECAKHCVWYGRRLLTVRSWGKGVVVFSA
jgi:hypothetical protein